MGRIESNNEQHNDNEPTVGLRSSRILQLTGQVTIAIGTSEEDGEGDVGNFTAEESLVDKQPGSTSSPLTPPKDSALTKPQQAQPKQERIEKEAFKNAAGTAPETAKSNPNSDPREGEHSMDTTRIQPPTSEGSLTASTTTATATNPSTGGPTEEEQQTDVTTPGAISVPGIGGVGGADAAADSSHLWTASYNNSYDHENDEEPVRSQAVLDASQKDLVQAYLVSQREAEATILNEKEIEAQFLEQNKKKYRRRRIAWAAVVLVVIGAVVLSTVLVTQKNHSNSNDNNNDNATPSVAPSSSAVPSLSPTRSPAPTQNCGLDMHMECIEQSQAVDCHEIINVRGSCQGKSADRFTKLGFVYTGRNCSESTPTEERNVTCTDHGQLEGDQVFVVVRDLDDEKILYFWGLVDLNSDFYFSDIDSTQLNFTIYNYNADTGGANTSPDLSQETLLQQLILGSDCFYGLQLGFHYGSLRAIEFRIEEGEVASCITTARLTLSMQLSGGETLEQDFVTLQTLEILSNRPDVGYLNKTDEIQGTILVSPDSVSRTFPPTSLPSQSPSQFRALFPTHSPIEAFSGSPSWLPPIPTPQPQSPPPVRPRPQLRRRVAPLLSVSTEPFSMVLDLCERTDYEICYVVSASMSDSEDDSICASRSSYTFAAGGSPIDREKKASKTLSESYVSICGSL